MKKAIALLTLCMMLITCTAAQAATGIVQTVTITASGTLSLASSLSIDVTSLTLNGDANNLVVTAPEVIGVTFEGGNPAYQAITVTTANLQQINTEKRTGLVGEDGTTTAPLSWTVFGTSAEASAYSFAVYADGETISNPNYDPNDPSTGDATWDVSGQLDPTYQPYLVDGRPNTLSEDDQSYASAIWDISGATAKLADFPENASGTHAEDDPREVTGGEAFLKFATDYTGKSGQVYTTTVYLDLITVS